MKPMTTAISYCKFQAYADYDLVATGKRTVTDRPGHRRRQEVKRRLSRRQQLNVLEEEREDCLNGIERTPCQEN